MPTVKCGGLDVKFPFDPYDIQKNYMEKVIQSLTTESNAVLESPTGTGKTLSLLCASLAWLEAKKAQIQLERQNVVIPGVDQEQDEFMGRLNAQLNEVGGTNAGTKLGRAFVGLPTIIYASRTHSQLSQAVQELRRTEYKYMRACVLGSREQMCIHPEVIKEESNAVKTNLCGLKVKTRSCNFYNRTEKKKETGFCDQTIVDIEDLVKMGNTQKFCPYYMAKELKSKADIIFMPYNYILDPRSRKSLGVELKQNIIILDEAHNIERICEDSASLQIKSTDITLCIEEVTAVMKAMTEEPQGFTDDNTPKDFTAEELVDLKQLFLNVEKVIDDIPLKNDPEGTTFEGSYMFKMLESAGITYENQHGVVSIIEKICQFLVVLGSQGPFQRSGNGLRLFEDLLRIVYASNNEDFQKKIDKCYKVHIVVEDPKKNARHSFSKITTKAGCRVINYWCFSPGFGMNMLVDEGIRSIILTSGTLAPLKPLISELELKVDVTLENPHVVKGDQVCVKVITNGPDGEKLNCNYQNRENENFLRSLGQSVMNLTRMIPDGMLIFFPSYPIMLNCQKHWQASGVWTNINNLKPIYVEPKDKTSFNNAMTEYYGKIRDPSYCGAIFMGVCRGKISEGLDFADANGRAVVIIGIPYPPMKDPRVVLKKRYLNTCNAVNKEYVTGDKWYTLEATRAINQAIGRVIRHRYDYGAIILLDARFTNTHVQGQLSLWLRQHIKVIANFGELMRDLRLFYKNASEKLPQPTLRPLKNEPQSTPAVPAEFDVTQAYKKNFDFSTSQACNSQSMNSTSTSNKVVIHKRSNSDSLRNLSKKPKLSVISNRMNVSEDNGEQSPVTTSPLEFVALVRKHLDSTQFHKFLLALQEYKSNSKFEELTKILDDIFISNRNARVVILATEPYIKPIHKADFQIYWSKMR